MWVRNGMWVCMRDGAWVGQDAQMGGICWKGCPGVYKRCCMGGVGCPKGLNQEGCMRVFENVGQGMQEVPHGSEEMHGRGWCGSGKVCRNAQKVLHKSEKSQGRWHSFEQYIRIVAWARKGFFPPFSHFSSLPFPAGRYVMEC